MFLLEQAPPTAQAALTSTHVDSEPAVAEALAQCLQIEARRDLLAATCQRLALQLAAAQKGEGAAEEAPEPDAGLGRILRGDPPASLAPKLEDLQAQHMASVRDRQAMEVFAGKARMRLAAARRESTRARLQRPDFAQALQRIDAAAVALQTANDALRELVAQVIASEGRSDLVNASDFGALTIALGAVEPWRQAVQRATGAPVHLHALATTPAGCSAAD